MTMKEKKYYDPIWDFKQVNTKIYTHCFHSYPAMMIPQIANRLIRLYGKNSENLFDPYCGTGTSLVEASLSGMNAFGTDLNPLARLIAKTKTTPIELQILDLYLKEFNDYLFALNFGIQKYDNVIIPNFRNIDYWFNEEVKEKLSLIKFFINKIENEAVKNFFKVAFSETVRECSLTRNGEFKLYRMSEKQIEKFKPDVFATINNKLARNRIGLKEYNKMRKKNTNVKVYSFDTSDNIEQLEENSIMVEEPERGVLVLQFIIYTRSNYI